MKPSLTIPMNTADEDKAGITRDTDNLHFSNHVFFYFKDKSKSAEHLSCQLWLQMLSIWANSNMLSCEKKVQSIRSCT